MYQGIVKQYEFITISVDQCKEQSIYRLDKRQLQTQLKYFLKAINNIPPDATRRPIKLVSACLLWDYKWKLECRAPWQVNQQDNNPDQAVL